MMRIFSLKNKKSFGSSGLVILAVLSSACSVTSTQYVEKAKRAFAGGNYAEAEIDYQKAIQKDPSLGEAYFGLGTLELHQARAAEAFRTLSTATQFLSGRNDVTVALGDASLGAYLQNNRAASYYDQLTAISARLLKENPNSYDGLRLTGYTRMIDRKYQEAVDFLKRADAVKPMQENGVHALIQCLLQDNQGAEAEKVALKLIDAKKTFRPAYDTLYRYYIKIGRIADGEALLKTEIANNPGDLDDRLELAGHYARTQNESALRAVIQGIKEARTFPDASLGIGNFYVAINRPNDALSEFRAGVTDNPKRKIDYQKRIAEVLLSQGKRDEAQVLIDEVLRNQPGDFECRIMRAGINVDSGDSAKLSLGTAELQSLAKERPEDATTRFNLGKARLKSGDANGALADFKEALRIDPSLMQARLLAANTSLQTEDYAGAAQYADQILETSSDNPTARLLRAQSLAGLGNFTEATAEASRLTRDYPTAVEPKLELATLALRQKKFGEAESLFKAIYGADRKNILALQGVADVYIAQNRPDAAIEFLNQEAARAGSPQAHIVLADTALRTGKVDLAIQQYTQLVAANPKSSFGHLRLGDSYLEKGTYSEAINQFQAAKALAPKDPLVNSMLALSLHDAGRSQDAQKAYRETMSLDSGNPLVMNNLAYLMAETGGNLDEALRLAQDASRRQPANSGLSDTIGWIYLKKHLTDSAIQILSNVVRNNPRQPVYRYHLGAALLEKGDKTGAKKELQTALENNPSATDRDQIMGLLAKVP